MLLTLTIEGDYWDVLIYRGRLYLFGWNGSLRTYDYDAIVDYLGEKYGDRLALRLAFSRGDLLYQDPTSWFLGDPQLREHLKARFLGMSTAQISVKPVEIEKFLLGEQENPFDELPSDIELYSNTIYATTSTGLWKANADRSKRKYPVSTRPIKLWDLQSYSIQARGGRLALAAGKYGLFEYHFASSYGLRNLAGIFSAKSGVGKSLPIVDDNFFHISELHSSSVSWAYASLYVSSYLEDGYMALFSWHHLADGPLVRRYERVLKESEIFSPGGISWGQGDKLYRESDYGIEVVQFNQKEENNAFKKMGVIDFTKTMGEALSGGVAFFGTIIEYENSVVVVTSDEHVHTIPAPAIRWRVFPRSRRYENQLHVISAQGLTIYSFNQDYFVDQDTKRAGMRYWPLAQKSGEVLLD